MMLAFEHVTLGQRVLFGTGRAGQYVASELDRLGASRPMVIAAEPERALAETATADITAALWWDEVIQHVPVEKAQAARAAATEHGIDALVCVGGGSTTGLAKAVALTTGIPIIAVPTTYAGSEATNVWGMTEDRTKTTGVDEKVLPVAVVYDAELSKTLPVGLAVASGLNGLAHCVDSLWAPRADPINQALALEGARALNLALRGIVADPEDLSAREQALYGCYLAAVSFASAGSGLHHKICHVLGGTFDLPHAQTHATVLPYVLAYNAPAVPELAGRLAAALGKPAVASGEDPSAAAVAMLNGLPVAEPECPAVAAVVALRELYAVVDAPSRLADYGFTATGVPEAVERVVKAAPASNPVAVTEENITALLTDALTGTTPTVDYPVAR
ncbi:maleylacetate reductase [Kocuria kalidii]